MNREKECCANETGIQVKVDVTKIVKCICVTGAFIVTIVFAMKALGEYFNSKQP